MLHLTNWSSTKLHGPGLKWSIMALPRTWEIGDGILTTLAPFKDDLRAVQRGKIDVDEYRRRYEAAIVSRQAVRPTLIPNADGFMTQSAILPGLGPGQWIPAMGRVGDGDTLCCACARSEAAAGRCHRAWLAPFLVRAGWRVILDGVEVTP